MPSPYKKFRIWMLLSYAVVGAMLWSLYIAYFASVPPKREYLGDDGYRYAWTLIVLTGSLIGSICYVITWLRVRKSN